MDRDGTEDGYELRLTRAVADAVDVPVIASGGAGTLDHLVEAVERGRRRRRAVRLDLPLRHLLGARGQGAHAPGRRARPAVSGRADLRERVRRLPGMDELLPALIDLPPVYLVGGAVRHVLDRRPPPGQPRPGRGGRRAGGGARARRAPERARPRVRELRHRHGLDGHDPARPRHHPARGLRRAGRPAAGRAGAAGGGPRPQGLHGQRHGDRPPGRRPGPPLRRARRSRRPRASA